MISLTSPVETRAHGWPAWLKLGGLCLASTGLLLTDSPALHVAAAGLTLALYAAPGALFLRAGLRSLRVVLPFVVLSRHVLTVAAAVAVVAMGQYSVQGAVFSPYNRIDLTISALNTFNEQP